MHKNISFVTLPLIYAFRIPEFTRLTIRFYDKRTRRCQICTLSRKQDQNVQAKLKEYSGHYFTINIHLRTHVATFVSPDFSWTRHPENVLLYLAETIEEMLVTRRSTRSTRVTRSLAALTSCLLEQRQYCSPVE